MRVFLRSSFLWWAQWGTFGWPAFRFECAGVSSPVATTISKQDDCTMDNTNKKKDVDDYLSQVLTTIEGTKCISRLIVQSDNESAANAAVGVVHVVVAHYFSTIECQIADLQHAYETERRLRVVRLMPV